MKKNYISELRYCQKIKESHSFKEADGLQKKVRKKFKINPGTQYDAQKELRQIMCFWKEDWDYEHFHPVFLNPKVYYPIVILPDPSQQTNPELIKYAQTITKLIERLRIDQEVQVNYKIEQRNYITNWEQLDVTDSQWKYFKIADISNQSLLKNLNLVTKMMIQSVENSLQQIDHLDYCLDSDQIHKVSEINKELKFTNRIFDRHLQDPNNSMQQEQSESYLDQTRNLRTFVGNVVSVLDQMKGQNRGPSFISVQPQIGQLTYLLHPVLWAVNGLFHKQKVQISKVKQFVREFEESIPYSEIQVKRVQELDVIEKMRGIKESQIWVKQKVGGQSYLLDIKDNLKQQNERFSRVVFVNLDGYESEYNLEVGRNFSDNLMYISFPKFSAGDKKDINAYEERFYNKIMFEKTRLGETFSQNEELDFLLKQQKFAKSPQQYHENVDKLYRQNTEEMSQEDSLKKIDRNQKIFIFPIRMNSLFEKHHQDFPHQFSSHTKQTQTIQRITFQELETLGDITEQYESYFIRFIMRRFLYSQILKFKPTHLIISYSNRVVLEDTHFVEMVQELTNIGRHKLMLFPNFTTSFVDQIKLQTQEQSDQDEEKNEEEIQISNCCTISNAKLQINDTEVYTDPSSTVKGFDDCPLTLSFYSKLIRFLKITSGTYNLQQSYQNQSLCSKLKNVKIYPYVQFLFSILSGQYSQLSSKIDKDMLKADKYMLEERLREEKEELRKCVPRFYKQLFKMLQLLVIHGVHGDIPLEEVQSLDVGQDKEGLPPSPYTIDVRRVFQCLINIKDKEGMKRIRNYNIDSIKKPFEEFISSEEKQRMDSRYQELNHLFFKTRTELKQYEEANEATMNLKSTNSGLRIVTFKTGKDKILPIYKDTAIVYETNQVAKLETFVLVMNHLGMQDEVVKHYIGRLKLVEKPSFSHQTCMLEPICFLQGSTLIQTEKFKAKCEWNFKQTQEYLILYWPSEYDFVKASLLKMIKQQYEPRISHQIFIAKKKNPAHFYKVQVILDNSAASLLPRRGCSSYDMNNKVFIFGGVYERQFNYLNLQHDIVTIDLDELKPRKTFAQNKEQQKMMEREAETYAQSQSEEISLENCRLVLRNIKKQLYSQDYLSNVIEDNSLPKRINSFVRPKIDIEFFEAEDICSEDLSRTLNQDQIRTVIMIGGYGENFMFPHSLITYFYHIIKFNIATREILTIQKRNTIEKPIPINLKQLIKNKHIFQHFHIYENDTISQGLTRQDHYFFHRVAYNLSQVKNEKKEDSLDLSFKFLFMYATELYNQMDKNFVRFAQKTGQRRVIEESEGTKVEIVNGRNNNLFITNEDGTFLYSLNYKAEIASTSIIRLTHEAILSLDVNSNIVCALIKHKQHTKDKCVIASQKIELPNPKYAFQNQNQYLNLIKFKELDDNFDLHSLFMMKRNELIIVHGVSFSQYRVHDQIISTKYTKVESLGQFTKQRSPQIPTPSVSLQTFYDCTSFLARENQKIFSLNFMTHQSKQEEFIYGYEKYSLDMNSQSKQWKADLTRKYLSFYILDGCNQIYLGKVQFLQTRQTAKSKLGSSTCVISPVTPLSLSMNQYFFNLERVDSQPKFMFKQKEIIKVRVQQVLEKEIWPRISWKRIYKNQERYQDSGLKIKKISSSQME